MTKNIKRIAERNLVVSSSQVIRRDGVMIADSCMALGELLSRWWTCRCPLLGGGEGENSLYGQYLQLDPERICQLNCACSELL